MTPHHHKAYARCAHWMQHQPALSDAAEHSVAEFARVRDKKCRRWRSRLACLPVAFEQNRWQRGLLERSCGWRVGDVVSAVPLADVVDKSGRTLGWETAAECGDCEKVAECVCVTMWFCTHVATNYASPLCVVPSSSKFELVWVCVGVEEPIIMTLIEHSGTPETLLYEQLLQWRRVRTGWIFIGYNLYCSEIILLRINIMISLI